MPRFKQILRGEEVSSPSSKNFSRSRDAIENGGCSCCPPDPAKQESQANHRFCQSFWHRSAVADRHIPGQSYEASPEDKSSGNESGMSQQLPIITQRKTCAVELISVVAQD